MGWSGPLASLIAEAVDGLGLQQSLYLGNVNVTASTCRALACVGALLLLPSSVNRREGAPAQLTGRRRALLAAHSWLGLRRPPAWTKCESETLPSRSTQAAGVLALSVADGCRVLLDRLAHGGLLIYRMLTLA